MVLIANGGSALAFYTDEEKIASMETGFELSKEELQIRVDESMIVYLASDTHKRLVQTKLDFVIEDYSNISFDVTSIEAEANTISDVRSKFNDLRSMNMDLENAAINSGTYVSTEQAIWYSWKYLTDFMYSYVRVLNALGVKNTELKLILELKSTLFKELGFSTNLAEAFGQGISNVFKLGGEAIGNVTGFIAESIISPALAGIAEGILGKNWKTKLIIIVVVIIIIVILAVIGIYYGKSYVGAKAIKRATT